MFKIVKARYFTQICKHLDKSRNCAQNQDREKKMYVVQQYEFLQHIALETIKEDFENVSFIEF